MISVLQSLAPEAFIVLVGFILTRFKFFPTTALTGLSKFAFSIAIPILLFSTLARLELPEQPPWSLWGTYIGGTLSLMIGVYCFAILRLGQSAASASSMSIGSGFSNLVVLGIPFNLAIIGEGAAFPVYAIISMHAFSLLTLATLLAEIKRGSRWYISLAKTTKDSLSNPIIIGLLSGLAWSFSGLHLSGLLGQTVDKISSTAVPVALFALGGTLAGLKLQGDLAKLATMITSKLVLHPLWISFLALFVFRLPPDFAAVCILCSCLPTGMNAFLFASHYKQSERSAAGLILITTPLGLLLYAMVASLILP